MAVRIKSTQAGTVIENIYFLSILAMFFWLLPAVLISRQHFAE